MPSSYLAIKRMKVKCANINNPQYIVGQLAIASIGGFVGNLNYIASKNEGVELPMPSFAFVHHDSDEKGDYAGRVFSPEQHRVGCLINKDDYVGSSKSVPTMALQPKAYADMVISIVLKIEDAAGQYEKAVKFLSNTGKLKIAGGDVSSFNMKQFKTQEEAARFIRTGYTVVDRKDLVEEFINNPKPHNIHFDYVKEQNDQLDAILYYTHPYRSKEYPWMSMNGIGYILISDIENREGVRDNLPHAYCEPLIGLTQKKPIREYGLHFWTSSENSSNNSVIFSHPFIEKE